MEIKKELEKTIARIADRFVSSGVMQEETGVTGENLVFEGMPELVRKSAGEGMVLLKNDGVLPLKEESCVSLFGRCQNDYFYVGYGSGGDVNAPYTVSPAEGLEAAGVKLNEKLKDIYKMWCSANAVDSGDWELWGRWPMNHPEMPVSAELAAADVGG